MEDDAHHGGRFCFVRTSKEISMKTIKVKRNGRPATQEELQCAVEGKPLPPFIGDPQLSESMMAWSKAWKLDGDLCRCAKCLRGIIISRMYESFQHASGCPQAHLIAPWQDLRSRIPDVSVSEFITRKDVHANQVCFIYALDRAIKFHQTNTNDPHNIGNAVSVALTEVRDAFKAYMF